MEPADLDRYAKVVASMLRRGAWSRGEMVGALVHKLSLEEASEVIARGLALGLFVEDEHGRLRSPPARRTG